MPSRHLSAATAVAAAALVTPSAAPAAAPDAAATLAPAGAQIVFVTCGSPATILHAELETRQLCALQVKTLDGRRCTSLIDVVGGTQAFVRLAPICEAAPVKRRAARRRAATGAR